jgi:hypothetical protein
VVDGTFGESALDCSFEKVVAPEVIRIPTDLKLSFRSVQRMQDERVVRENVL